jgi:aryl-alcohol dehydrogenase-like predicted oxidoreductase
MTFGPGAWGADALTSRAIFDAYRTAGGNFVDTADIYSDGESETLVGQFIRDSGTRDDIVLATKFGFNDSASPLTATQAGGGNPNAGGAGAKNIHRALDASLKRLATDYIDLYWMHIWDGVTPVEEIVQTLGDLVRAGKIRYYALSDMPAWVAMKAATIAAERRIPAPIAMQLEYSLVARDIESEYVPAAREAGMGLVPWSPLAGGFLSGKYERGNTADSGRLSGANPFGDSKFADRNWDILDELNAVAAEIGRPAAQVALAWVMARPGVSSTLVGARTLAQLESNIAAASVVIDADQMTRLNDASAPVPSFSASLAQPAIRRMLFGGHDVIGWSESAFPGNPPAMQTQTSTSCGPPFTTCVDPMGAASVSASTTAYQQSQPSVCAIDMYVPSS